jgi:hypothetical protein
MLIADEADNRMNPLVIRSIRFIRFRIRCQPSQIHRYSAIRFPESFELGKENDTNLNDGCDRWFFETCRLQLFNHPKSKI